MGIEPTDRMLNMRPNGFEDRGHHQACEHFRGDLPVVIVSPAMLGQRPGQPQAPGDQPTGVTERGRLVAN